MIKKGVVFLFLAGLLFSANNMYAGEWDSYTGPVKAQFFGNLKTKNSLLETNGKTFSEWGIESVNGLVATGECYRLTKLPKDLESFVWKTLAQYTLEDGDVFAVSAGYFETSPKEFILILRITNKGKRFDFYGTRVY